MQMRWWRDFWARWYCGSFPQVKDLPVARTSTLLWGAFRAEGKTRTRRTRACGAPGCTAWRSGSGYCSADRSESPRYLWVVGHGRRSSNTAWNPRRLHRTDWAARSGVAAQNAFLRTDLKSSSMLLLQMFTRDPCLREVANSRKFVSVLMGTNKSISGWMVPDCAYSPLHKIVASLRPIRLLIFFLLYIESTIKVITVNNI